MRTKSKPEGTMMVTGLKYDVGIGGNSDTFGHAGIIVPFKKVGHS